MTESNRFATYKCLHCGTERPYGYRGSGDHPVIRCTACKTATRHEYRGHHEWIAETTGIPGDRIQSITFSRSTRV